MNEKMKLLIAYDGSDCSKEALKDLGRAGLPCEVQAVVATVTDVSLLPPPPQSSSEILGSTFATHIQAKAEIAYAEALRQVAEAHELAAEASERIKSNFPTWELRAEALAGTGIRTATELIQRASKWKADLIVVGSYGRSALGRLLLGSVSQQVVTEAPCSVRVARYPVEKDDSPIRLIIGVDGSPSARTAVSAIARRRWPAGSEARVIAVHGHVRPTGIVPIIPLATVMIAESIDEELAMKQKLVEAAVEDLRAVAGLHVSSEIIEGDPKSVLIDEAKRFEAECIFVGSRGFNSGLEGSMLGSVSAALVINAPCSVEVVRMREPP